MGEVNFNQPKDKQSLDPWAVDTTNSGLLLITCYHRHALYAFDPWRDGSELELIAGGGVTIPAPNGPGVLALRARFERIRNVICVDDKHAAYLLDAEQGLIHCISLPPHLFASRHL